MNLRDLLLNYVCKSECGCVHMCGCSRIPEAVEIDVGAGNCT